MQSYFKQLTVEEEGGGNVISRREQVPIHSILDWLDDLGVYHQLIVSAEDVKWLSQMNISVKDRSI